jgi:hypothetical protein
VICIGYTGEWLVDSQSDLDANNGDNLESFVSSNNNNNVLMTSSIPHIKRPHIEPILRNKRLICLPMAMPVKLM